MSRNIEAINCRHLVCQMLADERLFRIIGFFSLQIEEAASQLREIDRINLQRIFQRKYNFGWTTYERPFKEKDIGLHDRSPHHDPFADHALLIFKQKVEFVLAN